MKTYICTIVAALAVNGIAAGEPIDESVQAEADGLVVVENAAGSVVVEGWDRREVKVTGELGEGAEGVDVKAENGRVVVRVLLRRTGSAGETVLEIKAPQGSRLDIETASADVEIRGIGGDQRIATASGDVETTSQGRSLEIRSASGDIVVSGDGTTADSDVTSVSGDVRLTAVTGEVNGRTVSGDLTLDGKALSRLRLASTSGDVVLSGSFSDDTRVSVETISGDANITVQGGLSGEFVLSTLSGEIDNCFGPESRESQPGAGQTLRFTNGDGAAEVRLASMSGDVRICE